MPKHEYSSDNQPAERSPRGRDKRLLIIEAMERCGGSESGFYDLLVQSALGLSEDERIQKMQGMAFPEMMKRLHPVPKQVAPMIEFDYPSRGSLSEKANAVECAMAEGKMPPDIGVSMLTALGHVAKVEEITDIKQQLAELQEMVEALRSGN